LTARRRRAGVLALLAGGIIIANAREGHTTTNDAMTANAFHNISQVESSLWEAADQLRANSKLTNDEFIAVTAQQMKEGSHMPRADWKQMQAHSVPVPRSGLLNNFDSVIQPIIAQFKSLNFAIQELRAARDLLLPRLMSGELAV
jgi:hypothetical protein